MIEAPFALAPVGPVVGNPGDRLKTEVAQHAA